MKNFNLKAIADNCLNPINEGKDLTNATSKYFDEITAWVKGYQNSIWVVEKYIPSFLEKLGVKSDGIEVTRINKDNTQISVMISTEITDKLRNQINSNWKCPDSEIGATGRMGFDVNIFPKFELGSI